MRTRSFDYEEAARLYVEEQLSQEAVAKRLGVGTSTVGRALRVRGVPARSIPEALALVPSRHVVQHGTINEYHNYGCRCDACRAAAAEYQRRRNRKPCKRCGADTWSAQSPKRTGLCVRCAADERVTTVREDTLRCCECGEWKPDDSFSGCSMAKSRRGRHSVCRDCQAAVRQRAREARRVPCTRCGKPRLHPRDAGGRAASTLLCRDCWLDRGKAAA